MTAVSNPEIRVTPIFFPELIKQRQRYRMEITPRYLHKPVIL